MNNKSDKKIVQQKYRSEIRKKKQDKNAHISLLLLILLVMILFIIALYAGMFNDSEFYPYIEKIK